MASSDDIRRLSVPVLFVQSLWLFWRSLPALIGMGVVGAVFTAVSAWLLATQAAAPLAALAGVTADSLVPYATLIPITLAHAVYGLWACRLFARTLAPEYVKPLSPMAWAVSAVVVAAGCTAIALAAIAALPAPASLALIVVISALLACTPLLPALALKGGPASGFRVIPAVIIALPWLAVTELLGWPAQVCVGECWGLFEGGLIMAPLFGVHMFLAATTAALVSTLVHVTPARGLTPRRPAPS